MPVDTRFSLASKLAQFLRVNGDKVIDGSCKLSLTTAALSLLNNLFADIVFQERNDIIEGHDRSMDSVLDDVQFLYDFIKRTTSLKLFHGMQTLRGGVDLSCFVNLTVLELRKIPAHLIIGLDTLSLQLKVLICSRSIYLLKELFGSSIDEQNTTNVWMELKELNLSYNYLEGLDHTLKSLPTIEVLDVSHNNIKDTNEIQVLEKLCVINLSFNQLDHLPVLSSMSCRSLTKLYIRNNNLEDLDGLDCFLNLEELDVSFNCLSEYYTLAPFDKLKSLRKLNLEGNPLYFHKRHEVVVINYINPSVLTKGFYLNGKFLLVPENVQPQDNVSVDGNTAANSSRHQTAINAVIGDIETIIHTDIEHQLLHSSVDLDKNSSDDRSISSCSEKDTSVRKKYYKKSKVAKKTKKSREVFINELGDEAVEQLPKIANPNIPSHMKAKKLLEARRKDYGEAWLIPNQPFESKSTIPGIPTAVQPQTPKVPSNTPVFTSDHIHKEISSKLLKEAIKESQSLANAEAVPAAEELKEVLDIDSDGGKKRHISQQSDDIEVLMPSNVEYGGAKVFTVGGNEDDGDDDVYGNNKGAVLDSDGDNDFGDSYFEEESEDLIFAVESKDEFKMKHIFVHIGAKYATEKDSLTGKVLDKLDLSTLMSVTLITQEEPDSQKFEIQLRFDTVKPSRQKRLYIIDDKTTAETILKILQPFADAKTLREATLGALECFKCKSQFSKQMAHRKLIKTKKPHAGLEMLSSSYDSKKDYDQEVDACPNCGSHNIVQMECMPVPCMGIPPTSVNILAKKASDLDNISVGSSSSGSFMSNLFSSVWMSPMLKRKSQASTPKSQVEDDEAFTKSTESAKVLEPPETETKMRRNSSDITIISNPSQSSIIVLSDSANENNLNTIDERDSQYSMSPQTSQSSMVCKAVVGPTESEKIFPTKENDETDLKHQKSQDQDFYSLTDSDGNENVNSEVYHSPYKSTGRPEPCEKPGQDFELDESSKIFELLGHKDVLTLDAFKHLDHRLKLHLEINVFDKMENLETCLGSSIIPLSTAEEFAGLFVVSSKKVYIIKFLDSNSDSIEKIIKIAHSCPIQHLKQIKVILGNQGLSFLFKSNVIYTLMIKDADICNSFFSSVTDVLQAFHADFNNVSLISSTEETFQQLNEMISESNNESIGESEILLHVIASWTNTEQKSSQLCCIILTPNEIFVSQIQYKKQDSVNTLHKACLFEHTLVDHQKISDLVSLGVKENLIEAQICFINESSADEDITWDISLQTKSSLSSFIYALKTPWEKTFGISLQINLLKE